MTETRAVEPSQAGGVDVFGFVARFAPTLFLIALMALFAVVEPRFLSSINLFNVMRQVSITGLLAIGMTFVILTAGIDLSVGSLLAFAGLVGAAVAKGGLENRFTVGEGGVGYGWGLAALAAIAVGIAGGYIQGLAITRLKVPPFVVTLGGMSAFRGAALLFAAGGPISGFQPSFTWWGQGKIGPVPVPVIIFLAAAALAHITLRYTRYGRQVYAVGGNPEAARLSGLNVNRVIASVYVIMGFFAGLRRVRAGGAAQFRRGGRRHRLRAHRHRLGGDRRHEPVRRIGHDLRHGDRRDPDRRLAQRPRADERLVLHPADRDRRHHRAGGGLRHLRQVEAKEGMSALWTLLKNAPVPLEPLMSHRNRKERLLPARRLGERKCGEPSRGKQVALAFPYPLAEEGQDRGVSPIVRRD